MASLLDFEKPLAPVDAEIAALASDPSRAHDLHRARDRRRKLLAEIYGRLTPWQRTLVARHPDRPRFERLVAGLFDDFTPLAGDRAFGDDPAIQGGPARFRGVPVMLIGHNKGHDTASRVSNNFGMAKPEGYRKATRLMGMAGRFGLPVITLVDTPGAFPGIDAEERGQAAAIARATDACLDREGPLIAAIVGEGGSGGAVALAAANRVLIFEHAVYSVISPEGCASILWRDAGRAADAAEAMKMTAPDLLALGVADRIVPEPPGGAHRDPDSAIRALGDALAEELRALEALPPETLKAQRRARYLAGAPMAGAG